MEKLREKKTPVIWWRGRWLPSLIPIPSRIRTVFRRILGGRKPSLILRQQRSRVQRKNDCTAGYGWPCYNDWFAVDIMAGFVASSQSNALVKYFTRGECEGVCPEANLVTIRWSFRKTVLNKIKSKKIPPKSEIKNSGRNKPRGENANAGIIVCKGHAETLKAVICHLDQSKCAMLDLSKEGCGQIWSLVVTRTSNDVFQQNLHVWTG